MRREGKPGKREQYREIRQNTRVVRNEGYKKREGIFTRGEVEKVNSLNKRTMKTFNIMKRLIKSVSVKVKITTHAKEQTKIVSESKSS